MLFAPAFTRVATQPCPLLSQDESVLQRNEERSAWIMPSSPPESCPAEEPPQEEHRTDRQQDREEEVRCAGSFLAGDPVDGGIGRCGG